MYQLNKFPDAFSFYLFFFLVVILAFSSCKDDDENNSSISSCPNPVQIDSFPLSIGNSWKYHKSITVHAPNGNVTFSILYDHYWNVVADTIINGVNAVKISHRDSCSDGSVYFGASYCYNTQEGFYLIAQEDLYSSGLGFKTSFNFSVFSSSSLFNKLPVSTDTVYVPDTAICYLKFPSQVNHNWIASANASLGGQIQKRKYVGCQSVTTSAGIFDCLQVQQYTENGSALDSSSSFFYYYSSKGLISQSFTMPTTDNTGIFDGGWVNIDAHLVSVNF